ncbi:MAG: DUF4105 domain-containing protein [Thermomonas sp.]
MQGKDRDGAGIGRIAGHASMSGATRPLPWLRLRMPRSLRWLLGLALCLPLLWATLAIAYAPLALPAPWIWAIAFAAFSAWALWVSPRRWPMAVVVALFAVLLAAWSRILPSNEREWRVENSVLPRIDIAGDRVLIHDYRDFDYRGDEVVPRWRTRALRLSDIDGVDFFVSYWQPGPIAHTWLSFDVRGSDPVAISIEVRNEVGESFDPLPALFRNYELIDVVGDERDIVRLRAHVRGEQVYLYRLRVPAAAARRLFLVYAGQVNRLAARPEFYNLLSNNCTVNIARYADLAGRDGRWDIRQLLNGWSDRDLYDEGLVDTSLPFARLRERSHINAAAMAADGDPAFSRRIRAGRPIPALNPAPASPAGRAPH